MSDSSASTSAQQTLVAVARTHVTTRHLRITLLLAGVFATSWLALTVVDAESLVPALWPAGGLAAGLLLTSPSRLRPALTAAVFVLMLAAFLRRSSLTSRVFGRKALRGFQEV